MQSPREIKNSSKLYLDGSLSQIRTIAQKENLSKTGIICGNPLWTTPKQGRHFSFFRGKSRKFKIYLKNQNFVDFPKKFLNLPQKSSDDLFLVSHHKFAE